MTHIADYTTRDLAAGVMGLHDAPYNDLLNRATRAIDATIAAAVAAEREACAKVADDLRDYTPEEYDREAHKWLTRTAAAIRARSNGAGRE